MIIKINIKIPAAIVLSNISLFLYSQEIENINSYNMDTNTGFTFPIGYQKFHKKQLYNFQLNRWYSLGYLSLQDIKELGQKIKTFEDWKKIMTETADKKFSKSKVSEAAFYYRAAEFYTLAGDKDKEILYDKFIDLFYKYYDCRNIEKTKVPYKESFIPILRIQPLSLNKKGTIVMHGGFDSFIEEFYSMMWYFSKQGFEVIAFEGPGQGAALKKYGHAFDYEWEKPVKAVLDYYKLDDITLLGLSMGGYLCLRAAAFDQRIKRVISSGGAYDYTKIPPLFAQWMMKFFVKHFRNFSNKTSFKTLKKGGMDAWQLGNLMYITKKDVPMDAFEYAMQMNSQNLHCDLIKQDVLVLTGKKDHFIPFKLHNNLINSFSNAKSVTDKVFTKKEHGHNHCQIGNIELSLEIMVKWIEEKSSCKND